MKKLFWMAGLMMLAACSSHEVPTDGMSEAGTYRTVVAKATLPGGESRLALTEVDGKTIKVDWKESGEAFSVMTGTSVGDPVTFTQTTGDEFTGTFPDESWNNGPYYAFYPQLEKDEDGSYLPSMYTGGLGLDPVTTVSAEKVPFNLMFQTGKLEDLSPLMMAVSEDGENYAFKHLTTIVKLTLTGMEEVKGKPVLGVMLMGPNAMGYYNLKTKEISLFNESMEGMLGVQIMNTSPEDLVVSEDGSVSVYLCLPPVSKDTPLQARVAVHVQDGEDPIQYMNVDVALTKDLEAGKYYRVKREVKTMEEIAEENKFTAGTPQELMEFAKASNENVVALPMSLTLTADIDMTGRTWTPINQNSLPFSISIDGGGHTIRNLTVQGEEYEYCGFIANLEGGSIVQNLHFENIQVTGYSSGGIVGWMGGSSLIAGCSVSGQVTGSNAGGIVEYIAGGSIAGCLNAATVTATDDSSGGSGGIAGENNGEIVGCINTGSVTGGGNWCGAIVGYNHETVSNCYWSGDMAAGIGNETESTAVTKVQDWITFNFTDLNNSIAEYGCQFVFDETTKQPKLQKISSDTGE